MIKSDPIIIERSHKTYTKYIFIYDDSVTIVYYNLQADHWKKIIKVAKILSETKLGPQIYNIDHEELSISMEKIIMMSSKLDKNQIDEKINQLHSYKLLHNDLNINNIGYRIIGDNEREPVIIDYDTITPFNNDNKGSRKLSTLIRNDKKRYLA